MVDHLLDARQGHPVVLLINLRQDIVLECNGATYSWREKPTLADPINMPGISGQEIEVSVFYTHNIQNTILYEFHNYIKIM